MIKSGIYQIRNLINNKTYIGSAVNLQARKTLHFLCLKNNKHHSIKLQHSYNKYGEENFKWEVIEYCEKEKLLKREQYYLDTLKPYYNISPTAGSLLGIKKSKEERLRISIRKQLRDIMEGGTRKGAKNTKEHRKNISLSRKGQIHLKNHKPIFQIDLQTNLILKEWKSIKEAHIGLNKSPYTGIISRACGGFLLSAYGFKWEYKK